MLSKNMVKDLRAFVIDVDGVMTTGQFFYSLAGKVYKTFGPDDHDALCLLRDRLEIRFVTGDKRGFEITRKRIEEDMGYPLDLVSTIKRAEWISERWPLSQVIYMGDGIFDPYVFSQVGYSIAPQNSLDVVKKRAHFVTSRSGGDRAVAEACLHLLDKLGRTINYDRPIVSADPIAGGWTA